MTWKNDKEQLENALSNIEQEIDERISPLQDTTKQLVQTRDVVQMLRQQVKNAPSGLNFDQSLKYASGLQSNIERLNVYTSGLDTWLSNSGTALYSTAIASGTVAADTLLPSDYHSWPMHEQQEFQTWHTETINAFHVFVEQPQYRSRVTERMHKLGFAQRTNGNEALNHFHKAWEAHERAFPSPTGTLITMRSALDETVSTLWDLRPCQSGRAKKRERLIALGEQVAAPYADHETFEELQKEWGALDGAMSDSKQPERNEINRDRERELMVRASLFLEKLLNAVDNTKLRSHS
ncbi:MAG: hypothetical protein JW966_13115 [Anaerolineae bacterium]|nr:hypothetical protein [Anaerolineae bacterium]